MSDYIHSLVARQLGAESQVRPRLLSLFEPPGKTAALLSDQLVSRASLDLETVEAEGSDRALYETESSARTPFETERPMETPPGTRGLRPHSTPGEYEVPVWRGQQVPQAPRMPVSEKPEPEREPEGMLQTRPQQQAQAVPPLETDKLTADARPPFAMKRGADAAPRTVAGKPLPPTTPPTGRRVKVYEQARTTRLVESNIDAPVDATEDGVESRKNRPAVRPRVILPIENRVEAGDSILHAEPQATEAPSTISVTIGRIEVRAERPEASRPRSQPQAKPQMSLDEYLRRRTKGGVT